MTTKIINIAPSNINVITGPGPGGTILVIKDRDETRISTITRSVDTELLIPLASNERWIGNLNLYYQANAAIDIATGFIIPSGATGRWGGLGLAIGVTTFSGDVVSLSTTTFSVGSGLNLGGVDAADSSAHYTFMVQNGATAGNLIFVWAQRVSTATDITVFANSFIIAHRL